MRHNGDRDANLLREWNDSGADVATDSCLHELFEARALRQPDAIAVLLEGTALTYGELNRRANRLARQLQALGAGPDVLVGICLPRSLEMVVGLLGILKAGAAYVPLDPDYPAERLAFMLEDAEASVILTEHRLLDRLSMHVARVLCLDHGWEAAAGASDKNPSARATPANLAYMMYTSGSTGRPKGVLIPHRAVLNTLHWLQETFELASDTVVAQKTSISFTDSVWELFWPLIVGARLAVIQEPQVGDPRALYRRLRDDRVAIAQFVPSFMNAFLEAVSAIADPDPLPDLRWVFNGGEALPVATARQWNRTFRRARIANIYGMTESAIYATCHLVEADLADDAWGIPVGRPIRNARAYVVGETGELCPADVVGEICVGGTGLARGYHRRPELTAEKFVADPFVGTSGARMYRTGDMGRQRADGSIEYLGRVDHQVKIRGLRIELGEIETVLSRQPGVRETVVLAREDVPGEKRLVAYVVRRPDREPTVSDLRASLTAKLPIYMAPSAFVMLDAFPLTPNGKVDRRALPAPGRQREDTSAYVAPHTPMQVLLAEIWQAVLGVDRVAVHDTFLDLGGDSLLLMKVVLQIERTTGQRLNPAEVASRTLGQLAARCERGMPDAGQVTGVTQATLEPFYFGEARRKLFGIYHAPPGGRQRESSLLFCYPFGQEYIRAHRSFRQLAVRASTAGFPVLRFDYYGCGDSMGCREDGSVRQWLNDVSTGIEEVRRRGTSSTVSLVGLRFGATLAMLAAADRSDIAGLVLWDPIPDGKAYLDELTAEQRRTVSPVTHLDDPSSTEALGFPLTPELSASIGQVSLAGVSRRPAPRVLVIDTGRGKRDTRVSDALTRLGARVETRHIPGPPVWNDEQAVPVPSPTLRSIVAWTIEELR